MLLPLWQQLFILFLMIFHHDYVIRLIQQFVLFLAQLLKLKSKDDPEILLFEIEKGYQRFLGYPKSLLLKLNVPSLINLFSVDSLFLYERLSILGILLLEEAEILNRLKFNDDANILRKKGVEILKECLESIKEEELKKIILKNLNECKTKSF